MATGRKARRHKRRKGYGPVGASPGTLVVDPESPRPVLRAFTYGPDGCEEAAPAGPADVVALRGRRAVLWLNVDGLGDAATVEAIGQQFGLHRLALEDVVSLHQRPKLERYVDHHFAVARMPAQTESGLGVEQLAIFWGKDWVLSFQERSGDCFDPVRERLRGGKGRIRIGGPDYLVYALLDATIDAYYPVIEGLNDRLEALEEGILAGRQRDVVGRIHSLRRDLLVARRSVWPMRELVSAMAREGEQAVSAETAVYLRDCYDHLVQMIDLIENLRDLASGLMEVHISLAGYRMNEIMKVLTIIATIFIPLTFLCGLYGMNFDTASPWNMPELRWRYGYPALLAVMAVTVGLLLWFFRRKGWLGGDATVVVATEAVDPGRPAPARNGVAPAGDTP